MKRYGSLLVFLVLVAVVASLGAMFQPGAWYTGLAKPAWTPPGWLFGPVWTVLYGMIAVAGWMAWRSSGRGLLMALWGLQLTLNALWSPLMFGRHEIGLALVDIVALVIVILAFIAAAWRQRRAAALLFIPYLAWVSFATALNVAIWMLNAA